MVTFVNKLATFLFFTLELLKGAAFHQNIPYILAVFLFSFTNFKNFLVNLKYFPLIILNCLFRTHLNDSHIKHITHKIYLLFWTLTCTIEIKCFGNPSTWTLLRFASSNTNFSTPWTFTPPPKQLKHNSSKVLPNISHLFVLLLFLSVSHVVIFCGWGETSVKN